MRYAIEAVAEELIGTNQSLGDVVGDHLLEDWGFNAALREQAIRCGGCLFWFDPEEMDTSDSEDCRCEDCVDA